MALKRTGGATMAEPKRLNLALQGGGAHGAFTWGVLDRLLEEPDLDFTAVSGTSAGAMNAVVMAEGLLEGLRAGRTGRAPSSNSSGSAWRMPQTGDVLIVQLNPIVRTDQLQRKPCYRTSLHRRTQPPGQATDAGKRRKPRSQTADDRRLTPPPPTDAQPPVFRRPRARAPSDQPGRASSSFERPLRAIPSGQGASGSGQRRSPVAMPTAARPPELLALNQNHAVPTTLTERIAL